MGHSREKLDIVKILKTFSSRKALKTIRVVAKISEFGVNPPLALVTFILLQSGLAFGFSEPELTGETERNQDSRLWEDLEDPFSSLGQLREWQQPKFEASEEFKVPVGLEVQVQFWKRIYSELSQDQGLLHDTEDLSIVYFPIQFSDINRRSDINRFRKEYLRKALVDREKKKVIDGLKKLSKIKLPPREGTYEHTLFTLWKKNRSNKVYKKAAEQVRFQLGQRDKIVQGIFFSGRYLEDFEKIFEEEGLPKELTRLPFVESSYNVMARSRVGASGLWQLMPSVLNKKEKSFKTIDPRNYPNTAAKIAARVLKNNYKMLNAWPLAVTGYNHGPTGVSKLTKRCGSRELKDLADIKLCKGKRLGFASRNFYPSFLAILELERNATAYLGKVFWASNMNGVEIRLPKKTPLSQVEKWFDQSKLTLQLYNPHFLGEVMRRKVPLEVGAPVLVPRDKLALVRAAIESESYD